MFPSSRQLKQEAKVVMGKSMRYWFKITLAFIGIQLLFHMLQEGLGGMLGWYMVSVSDFPEAVTGYFPMDDGFQLIFRMEDVGSIAAISLTYGQIIRFLLINLAVLLLLAPLKMATLEQYWLSFRGETPSVNQMLKWYTKPKLFGKSVIIALILNLGCRLIAILALLPSSVLYIMLYGGTLIEASPENALQMSLLALLAFALLLIGALAAYYLYTMLHPISYCLAAQPDYSLQKVLQRGFESIQGYRSQFFRFRLSFIPWYFLSSLTYGVVDLYMLPYLSFSSFQFLQTAAIHRQDKHPSNFMENE